MSEPIYRKMQNGKEFMCHYHDKNGSPRLVSVTHGKFGNRVLYTNSELSIHDFFEEEITMECTKEEFYTVYMHAMDLGDDFLVMTNKQKRPVLPAPASK